MIDLPLKFELSFAGADHQHLQLLVLTLQVSFLNDVASDFLVFLSIEEHQLIDRVAALFTLDLAADGIFQLHLQENTVFFLLSFQVLADGLAQGTVLAMLWEFRRERAVSDVMKGLNGGGRTKTPNCIIKCFHFITLLELSQHKLRTKIVE